MLDAETEGSICKINPSPAMGYARRKLLTGNPYEQFDEGLVPERALVYSAHRDGHSRASFE